MATSSLSNHVTKEIESRLKQSPDRLFEVFLEIREPKENESNGSSSLSLAPEIIRKYPTDFNDAVLDEAPKFAYPCKIPPDEHSEFFTFVVLDPTGKLFRFGFCRRSNQEATCLCILSYYPWFEVFYSILNHVAQLIQLKVSTDLDAYFSSLYTYRVMCNDKNDTIEIPGRIKSYTYKRPDPRQLPSMLTNRNFTVMSTCLGPTILLHLFTHVLFERRILFVSSKLSHLTACVYSCLHLIYPMHWQSIFLPILPASMIWVTQCTAPYIIGIHSSLFADLNLTELGDVIIVNIDEQRLESRHNDLNLFPKYLIRNLKKGIEQNIRLAGDHLARVFLRAMACTIGNYGAGIVAKGEELDFDREAYLDQYRDTPIYDFMLSVANTQMFEQFSRYRTFAQLQRETEIDEFDLEVKQLHRLQKSKKFKTNKKIYDLLGKYIKHGRINALTKPVRKSKKYRSLSDVNDPDNDEAATPLFEQVQNKAEKLQTAMNRASQRVASEASSVRNNLQSLDIPEMIKRVHHSKSNQSMESHRISSTNKSVHQSSTPDLCHENGQARLMNSDHLSSSSSSTSSSSASSRCPTPAPDPTEERHEPSTSALIHFDAEESSTVPQPSPIVLNVIYSSTPPVPTRSQPAIDSKIKQLQTELQQKVQHFDGKRFDPRDEFGQTSTEIKKLVKQFDPLNEPSPPRLTASASMPQRHPSIYQHIPTNHVSSTVQNIQKNRFNSTAPASLFPSNSDVTLTFDPLAPTVTNEIRRTNRNGSNLIDFD